MAAAVSACLLWTGAPWGQVRANEAAGSTDEKAPQVKHMLRALICRAQ